MATHFPYDIYFPTTAEECKDPHGRMHLSCRRSRDTAGREVVMIHDPLGNASRTLGLPRTRGCAYPAAALVFAPNGGMGTVSVGTGEHIPMDQWLRRISSRDSTRMFVASDGKSYRWIHAPRDGTWTCIDGSDKFVASVTDDQYRTLTLDQTQPHLGVEILASFILMHRMTSKHK